MNNRIDIKIAVVGDRQAGKETFCKMLLLDAANKIRLNPLSDLGEIYMEVDRDNFKNSTKNIIKECTQHNNIIMKQTQIANIDDLRKNNIDPFFYRTSPRIMGLVNDNEPGRINRNVLLTFYFIGNNYRSFMTEITNANIIIYITDTNKKFDPGNELFGALLNIIKLSNGNKYLIPILNKTDNEKSMETATNNFKIIYEIAAKNNLLNISEPVYLSAKYAAILRMLFYKIPVQTGDISQIYGMDNPSQDLHKRSDYYFDKCGYNSFRKTFMHILNKNYLNMIRVNITNELEKLEKLIDNCDNFMMIFDSLKNRTEKLDKIFKTDYQHFVMQYIKNIFDKITAMTNPNINIIDTVSGRYENNQQIINMVREAKTTIRDKFIDSMISKNNVAIQVESFMPSNLSKIFDQIIAVYPPKQQMEKVVKYICEMYGTNIRDLLMKYDRDTVNMLYNAYFTDKEAMSMMSMLNEIKCLIDYDAYKNYIIKILLAKVEIAEYIANNQTYFSPQTVETIVSYCKCLRFCIADNIYHKYDFLFMNITDVCSRVILTLNRVSNARYLSDNLDSILNFQPDKIVNLDKFIIKMIKKTNYQAVIAEDDINTGEDSDVDIYGEDDSSENEEDDKTSEYHFTNADLAASDDDTDTVKNKTSSRKITEV